MNNKTFVKCISKLLAVCIMFGGMTILSSGKSVKASMLFGCGIEFHNCLDACGGDAQCKAACDDAYAGCISDSPDPYPIINRTRSGCLQACQQECSSITDPLDRAACYEPCWEYCDANYPKP